MRRSSIQYRSTTCELYPFPPSFYEFKLAAMQALGVISNYFLYLDDEGDLVSFSSQAEYSELPTHDLMVHLPETAVSLTQKCRKESVGELCPLTRGHSTDTPPCLELPDKERADKQTQTEPSQSDFSDQFDLDLAIDGELGSVRQVLREYLQAKRTQQVPQRHDCRCSLCSCFPIVGHWYRCPQCNTDLCELCQELAEHPHALFKVRKPQHFEGTKGSAELGAGDTVMILKILHEFGFEDDAKNLEAMVASDYNLNRAVELLLNIQGL